MVVGPLVLMTALPSLLLLSVRVLTVPLASMMVRAVFLPSLMGTVVAELMETPFSTSSYLASLSRLNDPSGVLPER